VRQSLRLFVTLCLPCCLVLFTPATALPRQREQRYAEEVRAAVASLGAGPDARVEVRLRDKTKLKGYVSRADEDGFVVVNARTGAATQVAYPQVKKVKGHNLSTGDKILLGWFIVAAVATAIVWTTQKPRRKK